MEIKLKCTIIIVFLVLLLCGCGKLEAAGQNIVAPDSVNQNKPVNTNGNHNTEAEKKFPVSNPSPKEKDGKPLTGAIKIQNPPPEKSGNWEERLKWKKVLEWGNQCIIDSPNIDSNISTNDNAKITEANPANKITAKDANQSDESADENAEFFRTRVKPENKTIKLKEKLIKQSLGKEEWIQFSKLLGWNGFCESNSGTIYSFGKNTYILELPCN